MSRRPPDSDPPATSDSDFAAIVAELKGALAEDGWDVTVERHGAESRCVVVTNPLSVPSGFTVPDSASPEKVRRSLWEWAIDPGTRDSEFAVIAAQPRPVCHPLLINHLRVAIGRHRWSPPLLEQILEPLVDSESLTEGEATWVLRAGSSLFGGWDWPPLHAADHPGS